MLTLFQNKDQVAVALEMRIYDHPQNSNQSC